MNSPYEAYLHWKRLERLSKLSGVVFILALTAAAAVQIIGSSMLGIEPIIIVVSVAVVLLASGASALHLAGRRETIRMAAIRMSPRATWTVDAFGRSGRGVTLALRRSARHREAATIETHAPELYLRLLAPGASVVAQVTPSFEGRRWGMVDWAATDQLRRQKAPLPQHVATMHLSCSACGAQLPPAAGRPTVICTYCETENHVVRA